MTSPLERLAGFRPVVLFIASVLPRAELAELDPFFAPNCHDVSNRLKI